MTSRRIHVVGRKNCGKTTLVCELVRELTARGLRVGTIKHTHHEHELDTPGKDSWKHRQAGATAVGILSAGLSAVFFPNDRSQSLDEDGKYGLLDRTMQDFDLTVVEGDLHTTAPRIEVWRAECDQPPYAQDDPGICCVVTDDDCPALYDRQIPRESVSGVADLVLSLLR